jgi:hypothetical protein
LALLLQPAEHAAADTVFCAGHAPEYVHVAALCWTQQAPASCYTSLAVKARINLMLGFDVWVWIMGYSRFMFVQMRVLLVVPYFCCCVCGLQMWLWGVFFSFSVLSVGGIGCMQYAG